MVTGREDADEVLEDLVARDAFAVRVGGPERGRYRYHPLLRDVLRRDLHAGDPSTARRAHADAARACTASGHVAAAVRHHLAAGAPSRAWAMLRDMLHDGPSDTATVAALVAEFPTGFIDEEPTRSWTPPCSSSTSPTPRSRATWTARAKRSAGVRPPRAPRMASQLALLQLDGAARHGDPAAVLAAARQRGTPASSLPPWARAHVAEAQLLVGRPAAAHDVIDPGGRDRMAWREPDVAMTSVVAELAWAEGRLRQAMAAAATAACEQPPRRGGPGHGAAGRAGQGRPRPRGRLPAHRGAPARRGGGPGRAPGAGRPAGAGVHRAGDGGRIERSTAGRARAPAPCPGVRRRPAPAAAPPPCPRRRGAAPDPLRHPRR